MNKPKLYCMVGLSASGKSTIATQIANENPNTVIVSSDAIREELTGSVEDQSKNEEVFKIFHDRIRKNLENKKNVVADATNLTMKSRRAIITKINGLDVHKICLIIAKPFDKCKEDNIERKHPVPEWVLDKQVRSFQVPFMEEGFNEIIVCSYENEWDKYKLFSHEIFLSMFDFDQKNPHHTMTLDKHCMSAYRLFCGKYPSKSLLPQNYINNFIMGAMLHDIGKTMTQTFDEDGIAHYYNHGEVGSYFILTQLRTPMFWTNSCNSLLNCCFLINYHMLPFSWSTEKAKDKWKERFGDYKYQLLLDFNECDKAR